MTADTKSSYAGRGRIDPVQAVFVDREVESAYRVAETRDVAALLGIGVIFYILAVFGIFIWDTLRGAAVPGVLWALRAVTVATGLAVVLRLRRDQNPARADVLSYIWLTLAVIAVLAGLVERERDLALTVMFISLAGFTVYWMAPGRLLAQTFLASLYTIAAALVFLLDHQSTVAEFGLAVFTVVFTNILGVAAARRWHMLRRLGFFGRIETDEARRRAEFAERTQAAFTGIMSAHLREELDALRGRIEALPEEEDEFTRRMAAMSAAASAQGLVRLLDDALAVLRRRPGDIRIEESEFPLQDVAARVISDLNDIAGAKGVEIDYVRATDLPDTVIGDEARVDYVLRSLLRRAVFVTHGGAVEFRLEPVETTPGTLRVRFAIADRGSPPALGDPDSLFLPEPSIGPDGSPVFESRALDLYRSRMIVERLGGRIDVHI
ncbi:MAG: HAMP domain-containing histidine kinase, partial [Alphaproteobacteria bacterium]|nr:HAMP domain-containing histidine kinase [Alphaproteobacteria bacterium]